MDRTATKQIFIFRSRIGRNSRSFKFHFERELSQISAVSLNGSNRSAICELWQSETQLITEITFLAYHTYLYKTGLFWQNFTMTSPETSHTKNVANKLSFLLVTHTTHFGTRFGRYGILKLCFSSEHVQDRSNCIRLVRFLGHKMGNTC
jgi:hypothetical protein